MPMYFCIAHGLQRLDMSSLVSYLVSFYLYLIIRTLQRDSKKKVTFFQLFFKLLIINEL